MAPAIPSAELRLSYPLYALDFDPEDADRLLVGGGGGAARSGVGNKVSVLDVSHGDALQVVSEIELSRDEDSVNTLAVGSRRKNAIAFYTGINSAEDDLKKGKNEHFRVFAADLPSKAKAAPKITELSRSALFSTTDTEAYQRLLKISGPFGAAATGTTGRSKDAQIAIFDLAAPTSSSPAPKLRGEVELAKEAVDMDMMQISDDEHQLIYCDDYDIYTLIITKKSISGPHSVFTIPHDVATGAKDRPSFRCIRFLTPTFVLAVANLPKPGGAVLQGFRLPKIPDLGKEEKEGKARLAVVTHLPKSFTRATGLAVRNLSPPATPSAQQEDTQFAIAVTGQDSSITLFTLEHQTLGAVNLIANLHPVTTLKEVHLGPISGLAFSHPTPPPTTTKTPSPPPPHLKLASIGSMANTCVVHTLPLKPHKTQPTRHVLALKSRAPSGTTFLVGSALFFALLGLLLQSILEIKGLSRSVVGARSVTPVSWHRAGAHYGLSTTPDAPPVNFHRPGSDYTMSTDPDALWGMVNEKLAAAGPGGEKVVLHHDLQQGGVVGVERHDEERHGEVKVWEELHPAQRKAWREVLEKAGHWGEQTGEAVFKGVLFGQIAGVVGAMV